MILPDLDDPHQEPGDPDPNLSPNPDLFDIKYLYIFCKNILKLENALKASPQSYSVLIYSLFEFLGRIRILIGIKIKVGSEPGSASQRCRSTTLS
jgi:hypothetical protein